MTTRRKLIEFLYVARLDHGDNRDLANALIKEGFCKVDEPREFWINIQGRFIHAFFTEDQVIGAMGEVIHVREVVEE